MKKLYIGLVALIVVSLVGLSFLPSADREIEYNPTNYNGLVSLGLAPNSNPRIATELDIDTGLRAEYQGQVFGLFESRSWKERDYGKTFVSPISK